MLMGITVGLKWVRYWTS